MGLYHFPFMGKERTVAVLHDPAKSVVLRFLDEEILQQGIYKITLDLGVSVENQIDLFTTGRRQFLLDLLHAVFSKVTMYRRKSPDRLINTAADLPIAHVIQT